MTKITNCTAAGKWIRPEWCHFCKRKGQLKKTPSYRNRAGTVVHSVCPKCSRTLSPRISAAVLKDRKISIDDIPFRDSKYIESAKPVTPTDRVDYVKYLNSDQWQEKRREALERAGRKCQLCSRTRYLQIHHNTYERLGNELPTDLCVLCRTCHRRHHGCVDGTPIIKFVF